MSPDSKTNFSVTVATYNRPQFIHRMLEYHASVGGRYPIHIADDSEGENLEKNKELVGQFIDRGLDIKHHIAPQRLGIVESNCVLYDAVETPFCASTCDDDFVSIEFLNAASAYIANHPECAAVAGSTASFHTENDAPFGQIRSLSPAATLNARYERSAVERILNYEDGSTTLLYFCMRRTSDCRDVAALSLALRDSSTTKSITHDFGPALFEHCIFDHLTLARGTVHSLPNLMLLRHHHQDNGGALLPMAADFIDVMMEENWLPLAQHYLGAVSETIAANDRIPDDQARQLAMQCLWTKLAKRLVDSVGKRRARGPYPHPAATSLSGIRRILRRMAAEIRVRRQTEKPNKTSGIINIRRTIEGQGHSPVY